MDRSARKAPSRKKKKREKATSSRQEKGGGHWGRDPKGKESLAKKALHRSADSALTEKWEGTNGLDGSKNRAPEEKEKRRIKEKPSLLRRVCS